ncbi:MAG: cytochrome c [Novosphingobium sp.]
MTKPLIGAFLAVAVAAVAGATIAVAATPAETITIRQNNFKQIGRAQKSLSDELKKPAPDVAVLRASAQTLATFAPQVNRWFPRGSGKETGAKTGALPAIWQQTPRFNASAAQFVAAATGLQRAAATGDAARVRAAFPAVGASCKGCHDTFKGDK